MTKFKLKLDMEYEVEADDEDTARNELEESFAEQNTTAENEFWNNIEVEEITDE